MTPKRREPKEEIPFETALERLEGLVDTLERGDLALEESLEKFEEGVRLVRLCSARLHAAEVRIRELEASVDGTRERAVRIDEDG